MAELTAEQRGLLQQALYRVDAGSVGAHEFRQHVVEHDLAPVVAQMLDEARKEALQPLEDLFAGGPDTACRTVYRDNTAFPTTWTEEYVEVPMNDLREAFRQAGRAS